MFLMAVCGNAFYGCGVLFLGDDSTFILNHLPWLVGSIVSSFAHTIAG